MRHSSHLVTDTLRRLGYHGVYALILDNYWSITFWKGEYKLWFSISCKDKKPAYDEIKHDFLRIFLFVESEMLKGISADDDVQAMLFCYLSNRADFADVRYVGKIFPYIHADKDGKEYSAHITIYTEENHSPVGFDDEDVEETQKFYNNELSQLLADRGLSDFEVQFAPDLLSVEVAIRFNHKIHRLNIHVFYNNDYYDWKSEVAYIILRYREMLSTYGALYIHKYGEYLQQWDFCEVETTSDGLGNFEIISYCYDNKFGIKISIENEKNCFDNMEGHEFEHFCAELLEKNGFADVSVTKGSGDQGVDIIAYRDDVKYGIQCKCYTQDIGNKAVQEVFAGKTFYQCHVGVVLTNRYFRESAKELAKRSGVILWDRDKLINMVEKYNQSSTTAEN